MQHNPTPHQTYWAVKNYEVHEVRYVPTGETEKNTISVLPEGLFKFETTIPWDKFMIVHLDCLFETELEAYRFCQMLVTAYSNTLAAKIHTLIKQNNEK